MGNKLIYDRVHSGLDRSAEISKRQLIYDRVRIGPARVAEKRVHVSLLGQLETAEICDDAHSALCDRLTRTM